MSEALVPAAAEPVVVADGEADVVLPALIVDAGPDCRPAVPRVLRGADREREDAGGVRAGRGAVSGVVRGATPRPRRRLAAPRRRLHPDPPGDRSRPSSSTSPRSAYSATGSSSTRSSR